MFNVGCGETKQPATVRLHVVHVLSARDFSNGDSIGTEWEWVGASGGEEEKEVETTFGLLGKNSHWSSDEPGLPSPVKIFRSSTARHKMLSLSACFPAFVNNASSLNFSAVAALLCFSF